MKFKMINKIIIVDLILLLLICSIVGWVLFRSFTITNFRPDSEVFVVAGYAISHGQSPYDLSQIENQWNAALAKHSRSEAVFAYPPTSLAFFAVLGLFQPSVALHIIDVLNVLAYILLLVVIALLLHYADPNISRRRVLFALLLAAIPMAISTNITNGQSSMILVSIMLLSFYMLFKGKSFVPILFLGIIFAIKPHYTFIPIVSFLLLFSKARIWLFSIIGFILWSFITFLIFKTQVITQFLQIISLYSTFQANDPKYLSGFPFGILGFHPGIIVYISTALLIIFFLYVMNRKYLLGILEPYFKVFTLLVIVIVVEFCLPLHEYDHILISIVLGLSFIQRGLILIPIILPLLLSARSSQIIYALKIENFISPTIIYTICLGIVMLIIVVNFCIFVRKPKEVSANLKYTS